MRGASPSRWRRCRGRPTALPCWKRCGASGPGIGPYGLAVGRLVRCSRPAAGCQAPADGGVEILMDGADRLPNLLLPGDRRDRSGGDRQAGGHDPADTRYRSRHGRRRPLAGTPGCRLHARRGHSGNPPCLAGRVAERGGPDVDRRRTDRRRHGAAGRTLAPPPGRAGFRQAGGENQPLLSDLYYLERALSPSARSGAAPCWT